MDALKGLTVSTDGWDESTDKWIEKWTVAVLKANTDK